MPLAFPSRRIITDSNENTRAPLLFSGVPDELLAPSANLPFGDYSLEGLEWRTAVEFKRMGDLVACCTHRRDHFLKQLVQMSDMELPHVVFGFTIDDIVQQRYGTGTHPRSILGTLSTYANTFPGVGFHFVSTNPTYCASWTRELLCKAEKAIEKTEVRREREQGAKA